ncbi:DnaJ domain-containing protein [Amnibacterium sp. CER49]|uniref:DnaJ domain-containing protein n=1 Tax=Amnibacterium sp. CER49 TaxID=3039161 RepID=UPI002446C7CC|nr:DnaJ domain-containing protein [Amnibacterium sp. CER49]MDH2442342.1 DnaJ domain-containing protein [Amnibacterium sp. CER49]
MTAPRAAMSRAEAAEVLGVALTARAAEVQRAFLRLVRTAHPDALPGATEAERRAAAERFDRLVRARAVLLAPPPPTPPPGAPDDGYRPMEPDGPLYRPVPGRGIGGSLVVLVLLAFLLVALVSFDDAARRPSFEPGAPTPGSSVTP